MPRKSEQLANKPSDAALVRALARWFRAHARKLPWREHGPPGARDPYITLVSELMLQQTQVSRVLEKFAPFLARFPTVKALAAAPEEDVLAAWSGLGYYRRARLLQAAARAVMADFAGRFPTTAADLRSLPGIGRYTAGAIASLACGGHEPLVDGNVTRVLLRLSAKPGKLADRATDVWAWDRASTLMASVPEGQAGTWNEALMELGATVCTPMAPRCNECPVSTSCMALREGKVDSIPAPKDAARRKRVYWACLVVVDQDGRTLLRRRPKGGLFGGLEEPPLVETARPPERRDIDTLVRELGARTIRPCGTRTFLLTHRELVVSVWRGAVRTHASGGRWAAPADLSSAALANVQRSILRMAGLDT